MTDRYKMAWRLEKNGIDRVLPYAPFRYEEFEDTIKHICKDGEMLWEIAAKYYTNLIEYPSMFYDIIADFQPTPILDPTLSRSAGEVIYVPTIRVIKERILNTDREYEFENW